MIEIDGKFTQARWIAGLSNGENITEGKAPFENIDGELSAWQKLLKYLAEKQLSISSLQIKINGRTYTLPSKKPRFTSEVPIGYNYFRKLAGDFLTGSGTLDEKTMEKYICIEAIYKEFKLQLWVDEMGTKNSWVTVVKH